MDKIYKKSRAKINLTLNVLNKRKDGYHNIESVFQKISLYDEMYIIKEKGANGIQIESNIKSLECEDNIICKAYENIKKKFDCIKQVKVILKKNIPMQGRTRRRKC